MMPQSKTVSVPALLLSFSFLLVFAAGFFLVLPTPVDALDCTTYTNTWSGSGGCPGACYASETCVAVSSGYQCWAENADPVTCPANSGDCPGPGEEWSTISYTCKGVSEGGGCRRNDNNGNCAAANGWYDMYDGQGNNITQWVSTGACTQKQQKQQHYLSGLCVNAGDCDLENYTSTRWVDTGTPGNKTDGILCGALLGPVCRVGSSCTASYYQSTCSAGACTGSTAWSTDASDKSSCSGTVCSAGGTDCDTLDGCKDYSDVDSKCNATGGCASGTCNVSANITAGQDPNNTCGSQSCAGYYFGWSGNSCYYRADVSNNNCNGSGSCYDAASICPSQVQGGLYATCAAGYQPISGTCTGTTAGTCQPVPAFELTPNDTSYDYGSVGTGSSSDRTYTVKNSGGGWLIGGVSVTGTSFSCVGACADYSLAADTTKSYTIRFTPGTSGAKSGSVQFTSAPGRTVTLSGTGVVPDSTAPSNVTSLTSATHPNYTWKSSAVVTVSWTAATDNSGGSGLDGYSIVWDTTSNTLPDTTKDIEENITAATSASLANGSSYYFHIRSVDNAGNWSSGAVHLGPFYVDAQAPVSSFRDVAGADTPDGGSWQDVNFTVYPSDSDAGGSTLSACSYSVYSDDGDANTDSFTVSNAARTCGSAFTITVGPTGDCRNTGANKCQVLLSSSDGASNSSTVASRAFSITFLTYPSGTWQRLWYTTSGSSPNVALPIGNFKGEDSAGSINIALTSGTLISLGGINYSEDIGFRASRTIYFSTGGLYRFTLNSDDGSRLYIDKASTPAIDQWYDGSNNTKSANVDLSTGNHEFQIDYYENGGNAKVSFSYELLPTAPAPSGVSTDPSDTAIYVSWSNISGVSNPTYRLEWCKKSIIDGGGSFNSTACGPPSSPDANNPPYFITTTATSGYIIGTDVATAYNLRVRAESGTSTSYIFPGAWASVNNVITKTPASCNNVDPTNTTGGSSVTDDCFYVERRCSALDVNDGCAAACIINNSYLSTGSNPVTQIGTVTQGKWRITGSASYDLFARGHGVPFLECIGADWRSSIYRVDAAIYLMNASTTLDTASGSQSLNWAVTGEGGQEFTFANNPITLTFDKVFDCAYASCDLKFDSKFSGNTWTHKAFFPGGGGDYVRQTALMDTNISWTFIDETAPGTPTITPPDQWLKENTAASPSISVTATDNVGVSEIGYALKGKDCDFTATPADPCVDGDWKKARKSDLSGELAPSGTSVTAGWKISNADWDRLGDGTNTLYLRVKDAAGNCTGCINGTKITFDIKKDSKGPVSSLGITAAASGLQRTVGPDETLNTQDDVFIPWFKAGDYSISVSEDDDKSAGTGKYSGFNAGRCSYYIFDSGTSQFTVPLSSNNRTCHQPISFSVGPTGQCGRVLGATQSEGQSHCLIYLESYDGAGNINVSPYIFSPNIDRTLPGAQ